MRIDEPEDLHLVLFVRDACRLEVASQVVPQRLTPAVPDLQAGLAASAQAAAERAWPQWWAAALEAHRAHARPLTDTASREARLRQRRHRHAALDRPDFASLQHAPDLQQAARRAAGSFSQWWSPPLSATNRPSVRERPRRGQRQRGLGMPGVKGQLIDVHHGRGTEQRVVKQLQRELHRHVQPFDLAIEVLAVTNPPVILQDEHYAVISSALLADENAYHDWLLSTIGPLA